MAPLEPLDRIGAMSWMEPGHCCYSLEVLDRIRSVAVHEASQVTMSLRIAFLAIFPFFAFAEVEHLPGVSLQWAMGHELRIGKFVAMNLFRVVVRILEGFRKRD